METTQPDAVCGFEHRAVPPEHPHTAKRRNPTPTRRKTATANCAAADCVVKGACDDPAGLFPTIVKAKVCKAGPSGAKTCTPKEIPVVQAYFASK